MQISTTSLVFARVSWWLNSKSADKPLLSWRSRFVSLLTKVSLSLWWWKFRIINYLLLRLLKSTYLLLAKASCLRNWSGIRFLLLGLFHYLGLGISAWMPKLTVLFIAFVQESAINHIWRKSLTICSLWIIISRSSNISSFHS